MCFIQNRQHIIKNSEGHNIDDARDMLLVMSEISLAIVVHPRGKQSLHNIT